MRSPLRERTFEYVLLYKPYGVLSQFSAAGTKLTLNEFGPFPRDLYPVGRLDEDSEGLLILTNDTQMNHRLSEPRFGHPRTYLVQVEGIPDGNAIGRLCRGMVIQGRKTKPARVRVLEKEPGLPPRPVPIRFRKHVPTIWIEITLSEGRNRQVRRMTAAVGHPALRLVRVSIGKLNMKGLLPGDHRSLTQREILALRKELKLH